MIKKIATALLCVALGSSLYAKDISISTKFIGLEVGYAGVQGDHFLEADYTGEDIEFGFRIGAQNNEWRTMFVFDYYDSSDHDQNIEKGLFIVDYFFIDGESTFKPYIGVNAGYANYESTLVEDSGLLYGGQIGFVIGATETIDLDLSYRYSLSDAEALDHIGSLVLGVHYLF